MERVEIILQDGTWYIIGKDGLFEITCKHSSGIPYAAQRAIKDQLGVKDEDDEE